jgi:hypothetical protein
MEVVITTMYAVPCETETFTINGKDAYASDFGYSEDTSETMYDESWACGNRRFVPYYNEPIEGLLDEYGITLDEYNTICNMLEDKLYVGECHWCV